jgi:glucose-1-phosphate adenylyltransferase
MNDDGRKRLSSRRETEVMALVLAAASGSRLAGLTTWRAKSAVPFGAHFRTIDFALSNCLNSGIRQIALLTQYKSQSLIRHVQGGWSFLRRELGEFVDIWPAQQRQGERWYTGSVDAVRQNLDLIASIGPDNVLIVPGGHVYAMDYTPLLDEHAANDADLTVACVAAEPPEGAAYGFAIVDEASRVRAWIDQPPPPAAQSKTEMLTAMGIYLFRTRFLMECVASAREDRPMIHDFNADLLTSAAEGARVFAHLFGGYWRDVRTVDCYWQTHMDLLDDPPKLDLFDGRWPIRTHHVRASPIRCLGSVSIDSALLGRGSTIAGVISRSVLSTNCQIGKGARITSSVLLPGVRVGEGCELDHVIVDAHCVLPDHTVIGGTLPPAFPHYLSPLGVVLITDPTNASHRAFVSPPRKVA